MVHRNSLIAITFLLALIALVIALTDHGTPEITGAAYFSEPTFCLYDKNITTLECACGRARLTDYRVSRLSDLRGTSLALQGDWCLMQHQRELCSEACKYSSATLASAGQIRSPLGGTTKILGVATHRRPSYGPLHSQRTYAGAYSYVSGY